MNTQRRSSLKRRGSPGPTLSGTAKREDDKARNIMRVRHGSHG
jgi:hypothetical protein